MKLTQIVLVIAMAAVTSLGVMKLAGPQGAMQTAAKETAFERVMRTNTLRCAYLVLPPQFVRDPNTGAFSGVSYDVVTEAAKRLKLKVDWVEEVNFMNATEGFKSNRYDSLCLTAYRWVPWTRTVDFSVPLFYSTTDAYVRADDHRFDSSVQAINSPGAKIATIDGEASTFIREQDFPESANYSMPAGTDPALVLETIATKKADIALANPLTVMPYLKANPGQVRRVSGLAPIRTYSHSLVFEKGEQDLTAMFDVVLEEMIADGTINKIIDKYEVIPNSFVRVKSPVTGK